jgi:hypothetical protein
MADQTSAGAQDPAARLARLSDEFVEVVRTIESLNATPLRVSGFNAQVPDPGRDVGEALVSGDRGAGGDVAQHLKLLAAWMPGE